MWHKRDVSTNRNRGGGPTFLQKSLGNYETDHEPDEFTSIRLRLGTGGISVYSPRQHQDRCPLAAKTVIKSTYMDDSIDSVENEAPA